MKLMSTTDFVLEQRNKYRDKEYSKLVYDYANFLKQPLELWMFVPCDEDGNVLEYPDTIGVGNEFYYQRALDQYEEAKEKCLFKGFEVFLIKEKIISIVNNELQLNINFPGVKNTSIESIIYWGKNSIVLTKTALKQIGL